MGIDNAVEEHLIDKRVCFICLWHLLLSGMCWLKNMAAPNSSMEAEDCGQTYFSGWY